MNIIEERRRKAWAHATRVILTKVINDASTGILFIYGETLHGKVQRWNTRVTATASIDKEVMAGTVQQVMERIPNALRMLEDS